ncbi:MAG: YfiR family protein [Bryobacteraceae bacterium]
MAQAQVSEYALKAAFLYNFAKFVEWPAEAFSSPSAPLVLCTYGNNRVGDALQDIVKEKTIDGRTLAVREIGNAVGSKGCQVLFVGAAVSRDEESILASVRNEDVLVVGETPEFAQNGGAINFVVRGNRLRFIVNLSATDTARLKLSSKLLSLAILAGN